MSNVTGIPIAPLTGVLDARSTPDRMAPGSLRYRQNLRTTGEGKLRRGDGFSRLLSRDPYGDMDFHDQMAIFTPGVPRQPVTLLFEAISTRRVKTLIAGTQGKLAKLNEHGANWQILGSGYGGEQTQSAASPRFRCDQLGDYVLFTNDFDKPLYYVLEDVSVEGSPLLQTFADLDVIGLQRASVVTVWNNVVFLADVLMDATRFGNRIVWGNYLDPLSFDPARQDSIAGSFDLKTYERVLAARPTQSSLLWYTTHGIWEMIAVGGEQTYQFVRRYNGEDNKGAGVLKYPNTLVGQPDAHFYGAEDGIYVFSPYYVKPERLEWLHKATPVLGYNEPGEVGAFGDVDASNCLAHVAVASKSKALFSYARKGAANGCPDITLRVNLQYHTADVIDEGFTAFANHQSFDVATIRDFIVENQICTLSGLSAAGYPYTKEGLPAPPPSAKSAFVPSCIYTKTPQVFAGTKAEAAKTPTTVARTSGVATLTVPAHGYATNDLVTVSGMSDASFNVAQQAVTVINANAFTYPSLGPDVATTAASDPYVRKIDVAKHGLATVEVDGTATVKSSGHGLITGNKIRLSGAAGNPHLDVDEAAVTVLDANTFTYPTTAVTADTSFGMIGISNAVAGGKYTVPVANTIPSKYTVTGMLAGGIYKFTPGANGDRLTLTGPATTLTTETYFVYDGAGATLLGPNVWNHVLAWTAGQIVVDDFPLAGTYLTFLCAVNRSATATHPADDNSHWDPNPDQLSLEVTAIISPGLAVTFSKLEARQVPTLVSRNDATNPTLATITLAGHGYLVNDVIQVAGFSDGKFNVRDTAILAKTTNTFAYLSVGPVVTPEAPTNVQARRIVSSPVLTEDWTKGVADSDSLCALLDGLTIDSICGRCEGETLLVAASSADWCLKQMGEVFFKEFCQNPTVVGASVTDGYQTAQGQYARNGILSILRFAPLFGPDGARRRPFTKMERFAISAIAAEQAAPSLIGLDVGISGTVCDANKRDGRIVMFKHRRQPFKYLTGKTAAQHVAANTIPVEVLDWHFYRKGRFLYVELSIDGIGGDGELSEAMAVAGLEAADNF